MLFSFKNIENMTTIFKAAKIQKNLNKQIDVENLLKAACGKDTDRNQGDSAAPSSRRNGNEPSRE